MIRHSLFALLLIAGFTAATLGCARESSATSPNAEAKSVKAAGPAEAAVPQAGDAKADDGKKYSVVAEAVSLKVGKDGVASVRIKPAKGLKFNKDFPASFKVAATTHAKCSKDKLSAKSGDVKVDGKEGVINIPLKGLAKGSGPVEIKGRFSVCSAEQCYMLPSEKFTVAVKVD